MPSSYVLYYVLFDTCAADKQLIMGARPEAQAFCNRQGC